MKIALVTDIYYPLINGVSVAVDELATNLEEAGHEVVIIAPKIGKFKDKRKNIIRLASFRVLSAYAGVRFPLLIPDKNLRKFYNLKFDIVHAHGNGAFSLLGYQLARMKKIPYILTFHTLLTEYMHYIFKGKLIKPIVAKKGMKIFADRCDGIITPSVKMKLKLKEYGVKKLIHVIPNTVPKLVDNAKFKKHYLRKRFKIPRDSKIIITVGRIAKEKNFTFIIETFEYLSKFEKKSHLIIVGSGPELNELKQLVNKKHLNERIHFTGKIQRNLMPNIYKEADIFTFASITEVHPLVALEAASAALPLVVADDLAFENVIVNNFNGYKLPLNNKIFSEKLVELINNDVLREKFSINSKNLVEKNFSTIKMTKELIQLYEKLINREKKKISTVERSYKLSKTAIKKLAATRRIFNLAFK